MAKKIKEVEAKEEVKSEAAVTENATPRRTLREMIFDEENAENLVLQDEKGNSIEFYQIAMIPHLLKNYIILKPVNNVEGIGDDEAVVFLVKDVPGNEDVFLEVVQDEDLIDTVFGKFQDMLKEEEAAEKPAKKEAKAKPAKKASDAKEKPAKKETEESKEPKAKKTTTKKPAAKKATAKKAETK